MVAWCAVALAQDWRGRAIRAPLGGAVLLVTVLKLVDDRLHRAWPAWLGLLLASLIAVAAWTRARPGGRPA